MLKIAWSSIYQHPLPENHRFPMVKYELIPKQLLYEGTIREENLFTPQPLPEDLLLLTHTSDYWNRLRNGQITKIEERRIGFPFSKSLLEREIVIANGTVLCAQYALDYGVSMNVAGGTHHAFSDRGEGFCILNDQAITANFLLSKGLAGNVLIIDLDVHQGNGTAAIFEQEERVFTFSMHGAGNYPLKKEKSDLDLALPDHTSDEQYLSLLRQGMKSVEARFKPDFVLFQAGVDVLKTDKLGRMDLTLPGCKSRDEYVLRYCHNKSIPLVICMGGGYSSSLWEIVEAHANTFRLADQIYF